MFDGQLESDGPPTEEQLTAVPAKRGVLALLDGSGRPITLLTAADIRARLRTRLRPQPEDSPTKTADLRQITRKVLWKLTWSHFETDLCFLEFARAIRPGKYASLLAWRQAWFVHVNASETFPRFRRTRDVRRRDGLMLGPFGHSRDCGTFMEIMHDAFSLCRDYSRLLQAPHGQPCAYAQMGRCPSVCNGNITVAEYRAMVAEAADYAAGRRQGLRDGLQQRMRTAAEAFQFEAAGRIKARLDRLADLDGRGYEYVAPLEAFRFILVHRGRSGRQANVFHVAGGSVVAGKPLGFPLCDEQLVAALGEMSAHVAADHPFGQAETWRIGLVTRYLFSSVERRGVILRWGADLTAEALRRAILAAAEPLKLRASKRTANSNGAQGKRGKE